VHNTKQVRQLNPSNCVPNFIRLQLFSRAFQR
jgi:hypothetical protein